jgi:hypothetical protein
MVSPSVSANFETELSSILAIVQGPTSSFLAISLGCQCAIFELVEPIFISLSVAEIERYIANTIFTGIFIRLVLAGNVVL